MKMKQFICAYLWSILVLHDFHRVSGNSEGDALNTFKANLVDPNNVLLTWDPTQVNPCTWNNITCNNEDSVTKVELGNLNLSGQLVPELGQLSNLQILELYSNNLSGMIVEELGNLTNLVNLNLALNSLTGHIPSTLGKLQRLHSLRLNNNSLSGQIPMSLTTIMSLQVVDFSNNMLYGDIPVNGSFAPFTPISFVNNLLNRPPDVPPPPYSMASNGASGAISGGVAACAALLFAALAIV